MTHAGTAERNCWNLIDVASIVKVWEKQKQAQQFYHGTRLNFNID